MIWDSNGYLEPLKLSGKLIWQRTWAHRDGLEPLGWDEPLTPDILRQWENWKNDIGEISKMTVPRYIFKNVDGAPPKEEWYLHGFADGGEFAYRIVIYLRFWNEKNIKYEAHLIFASSRVAPTSRLLSTPRKELCALVLLVGK